MRSAEIPVYAEGSKDREQKELYHRILGHIIATSVENPPTEAIEVDGRKIPVWNVAVSSEVRRSAAARQIIAAPDKLFADVSGRLYVGKSILRHNNVHLKAESYDRKRHGNLNAWKLPESSKVS